MTIEAGHMIGGRYRVWRPLREGARGSIWVAEHMALDTLVAIKLMDRGLARDDEALERFRREASAAAQLRSPHVVQVLDHGVDEGQPYIVMELLDGEDLGERVRKEGRLGILATSGIVTQVARALTRAHAAGIVHRDLRPGNVFLVANVDEEVVKVLGFGVGGAGAATTDDPPPEGPVVEDSEARRPLRRVPYLSPEQLEPGSRADEKNDLWALAVIAYECVTGKLPFDVRSVANLHDALAAPRPEATARVGVPPAFDQWFERACAPRAADRFPSARELAEALAKAAEASRSPSERGATKTLTGSRPPTASVPDTGAAATRASMPSAEPKRTTEPPRRPSQIFAEDSVDTAWGESEGKAASSEVAAPAPTAPAGAGSGTKPPAAAAATPARSATATPLRGASASATPTPAPAKPTRSTLTPIPRPAAGASTPARRPSVTGTPLPRVAFGSKPDVSIGRGALPSKPEARGTLPSKPEGAAGRASLPSKLEGSAGRPALASTPEARRPSAPVEPTPAPRGEGPADAGAKDRPSEETAPPSPAADSAAATVAEKAPVASDEAPISLGAGDIESSEPIASAKRRTPDAAASAETAAPTGDAAGRDTEERPPRRAATAEARPDPAPSTSVREAEPAPPSARFELPPELDVGSKRRRGVRLALLATAAVIIATVVMVARPYVRDAMHPPKPPPPLETAAPAPPPVAAPVPPPTATGTAMVPGSPTLASSAADGGAAKKGPSGASSAPRPAQKPKKPLAEDEIEIPLPDPE